MSSNNGRCTAAGYLQEADRALFLTSSPHVRLQMRLAPLRAIVHVYWCHFEISVVPYSRDELLCFALISNVYSEQNSENFYKAVPSDCAFNKSSLSKLFFMNYYTHVYLLFCQSCLAVLNLLTFQSF